MTLIEMIETTGTIPNRFTTTNGVTMEYEVGVLKTTGEWMAGYWQIVDGKRYHLWAIRYGRSEQEAKDALKSFIITHGRNL